MGPCKRCIVRAGCTKDCKELDAFISICSQLSIFLAVMAAGVCAVALVIFTEYLEDPTDSQRITIMIVWIVCAFINVCINMITKEKIGELLIILMAPFFTFVFFFIYASSFVVKKSVRIRRA